MTTDTLESPSVEAGVVPRMRLASPAPLRVLVDARRSVVGYRMAGKARFDPAPPVSPGLPAEPVAVDADEPARELHKPTFVRCTIADLRQGQLEQLDPRTSVLEIRESAVGPDGIDGDREILKEARRLGFKLAFDGRLLQNAYASFVPLASYVILEMGVLELDRAASIAKSIQANAQAKAIPFATQVRTEGQFKSLAAAGVQMFEGLWFTKPPVRRDPAVQVSYAALIKLLNMVMREAEVNEVEELLRHEPTLAYKLLRHINTCGFGLKGEITSFRHAVMTVGQKRLFRWAALLVSNTPPGSVAPAAGTLAIVRGRMMELIALESLTAAEADLAFITGMFSMLDALLGMPLEDALALVDLPTSVSDAILAGTGVFGPFLDMTKACESVDEQVLEILSMRYRIPVERLIDIHLQALAWAEQFAD
ncbi:conserved hypothetical protein [Burkholderiales bacterium 8X]|nr:conserved hypothetical protein [Burkholderiales bacterium 8X]